MSQKILGYIIIPYGTISRGYHPLLAEKTPAEPYPANIIDAHLNIVMRNRAMDFVIEHFASNPVALLEKPLTMPRLNFHPDGLIASMRNPQEAFSMQLGRVHRYLEASEFEYESLQTVRELEALRPAAISLASIDSDADTERPHLLIPIRLHRGGVCLNIITVVATLGWAQDITLEELHVEYGFPADDASNAFLQEAQRNGWSLPD